MVDGIRSEKGSWFGAKTSVGREHVDSAKLWYPYVRITLVIGDLSEDLPEA